MKIAPALLLAGMLTTACSGDDNDATATSTTTEARAATTTTSTTAGTGESTTTTTTVAPDRSVRDLGEVIITDAPAPHVRASNDIPQGPFNLDSYLQTFSTNEEEDRQLLTACGFTRGYSRVWIDEATGRGLAVFVYECSSEAAALELRSGLEEGEVFDIPSIPGAQGAFAFQEFDNGQGRVDSVSFVRGPRLYAIGVQSESTKAYADLALDLAKRQAAVAR